MSLLHRHIFLSVLGACAAAVGLFAFILIVGNMLKDLLPFVMGGQLSPGTFLKLVGLLAQIVAAYALPMGVLTGVLLVLGRMSAQNEITAMRAAGLSLLYIARPVLILGIAGAVLCGFINFYSMPKSKIAYKRILAGAVQKNPLSFIVAKTYIRDFRGVVLYVGKKEDSLLEDVWIWELDSENRVIRSGRAASGRVSFDAAGGRLVLVLSDVSFEIRNKENPEDFVKPVQRGTSEEFTVELAMEHLLGAQAVRQKPAWMTLEELFAQQQNLSGPVPSGEEEKRARDRMAISFAMNEKTTTAVAVFAFALLAVPLGIKVSRKETSANLGVALLLVMSYYFLTVCVEWLDKKPALRPDILIWIPVSLFLVLGIAMFRRLGRV
ncbi:MAG: LptF/LptG family permease [Opitutaceae bacterium]|nr:LptF/LptG family permease [Opitutaceae bacterium]